MNFERFLDFNAFITDPKTAVEKAKELMRKEIEAEKAQLQLKVKQQEDYRKALNELKQQYEEMRQEAGIDKLEEKLSNQEGVKFEPIEDLPNPEEINSENIIDEDSKTAKISKNLENRYGINPTEVANEQGRILSDNEEYEDLKEIVDNERAERFLKEVDELEQNFNNPNQTQIVKGNFGYGDLASYL